MTGIPQPLFLARCELGKECTVVVIDSASVRVPDYNKPRATVIERKPRAWLFDARRTSLGVMLCMPGAAAWAYTADEAKAMASALLRQHTAEIKAQMRFAAQYQQARAPR
jgi:hypothetical protein